MKKHIILIIVLSVLPFLSIFFTPDLPHTSDGEVQIPRMAAFYKAVRDVHIPVRWAGDLNYGYGMPLFIFIYHTPFYISTLLIWLGISLVTTFKLVLFFSFLFSGLFMLLFTQEFFKDSKKSLFVTILYQFAPYHLIDILTRGTIGTIYVYVFFPLMLWGITNIIVMQKRNSQQYYKYILITAAATALMILSHNSMALIFFAIAALFILFFSSNMKQRLINFTSLSIGLGLSAFYWIPALIEHKYTYGDLFMKDLFKVNFPPFQNFFIPNPFNVASLRISEVAVHWGIIHTIAFLAGLLVLLKWKHLQGKTQKIVMFSLLLIVGSMIFMNPISVPIWEKISFLRQFQFPWRLLSVIIFATSFLSSILFEWKALSRPVIFYGSLFIIIGSTLFYWNPTQGYDTKINEQNYWNYPLNTTYFGETDVIWSAGPAHAYPTSPVEVITGSASITNFAKKTQQQTFLVNAVSESRLVSHTQYFPGWRVYVDGNKVPIEFQDQNWRGLLTFFVPSGTHNVSITFEETPIRLIADILSASTVSIATAVYLVLKFKKHI